MGAIHLFIDGRKSSVGGVTELSQVHGYFLGEKVYQGDSVDDAMRVVETKLNELPKHLLRGLLD
jgi:hypothetical protein